MIIFTKFDEDRTKNVFTNGQFLNVFFFTQTLLGCEMNVLNPTVKTTIVSQFAGQSAVKNKARNPSENKGQKTRKQETYKTKH